MFMFKKCLHDVSKIKMQLDVDMGPTFRLAHMKYTNRCTQAMVKSQTFQVLSSLVMNFFLAHDFFLVNFGPVPDGQTDRRTESDP